MFKQGRDIVCARFITGQVDKFELGVTLTEGLGQEQIQMLVTNLLWKIEKMLDTNENDFHNCRNGRRTELVLHGTDRF
jgi:hypothetical protein